MTQLGTRPGERAAGRPQFAVTDPLFIDRERYFDRGFFELEREKLWKAEAYEGGISNMHQELDRYLSR